MAINFFIILIHKTRQDNTIKRIFYYIIIRDNIFISFDFEFK